jgi:hypothetical protein
MQNLNNRFVLGLKYSVEKKVIGIYNKLNADKKIFIDHLRENLGMGYASDTNVYFYILGFVPHKKRKNLLEWYKSTSQILPLTELYEIANVLVKKKKRIEIKEFEGEDYKNSRKTIERVERVEKGLIELINSPKVRLVLNGTYDFKMSSPDLYASLLEEFGEFSNDMRIILSCSYEKVPLLTYDNKMAKILYSKNLPYIDIFKSLPYEYTQEWRKLINIKKP